MTTDASTRSILWPNNYRGSETVQTLNATVKQLNDALSNFSSAVRSMGLDRPGGLEAGLTQVRRDANRLADGSQQVAGGVDQLVGQVKQMGTGLDEAAAFLLAMRNDAADPSMAGFNLPAQILQLDEFKAAAKIFISPDGRIGPVPGANHTQSVQRRSDGSGQ